MKRRIAIIAATIAAIAAASPAAAVPGGALGTLPLGNYVCEWPGDATGPVGLRAPEADFAIINASSYATAAGTGTYLLTGDVVAMTSGPQYGTRYHRMLSGFLRRIEADGKDGRLRCILRVVNNHR